MPRHWFPHPWGGNILINPLCETPQIEPCPFGSWGAVLRYASMLREMKKAPPILLARQDNKLHPFRVIDGQHRYHAAKEARRLKIKAVIATSEADNE
jgi:hypothetical protein